MGMTIYSCPNHALISYPAGKKYRVGSDRPVTVTRRAQGTSRDFIRENVRDRVDASPGARILADAELRRTDGGEENRGSGR